MNKKYPAAISNKDILGGIVGETFERLHSVEISSFAPRFMAHLRLALFARTPLSLVGFYI